MCATLTAEGIVDASRSSSVPADLRTDTYDSVIASQVLEHVIRRNRFAREIVRVLRPGGSAFCLCAQRLSRSDRRTGARDQVRRIQRSARFLRRHFVIVSIEIDPGRELLDVDSVRLTFAFAMVATLGIDAAKLDKGLVTLRAQV